MVTVPDDTPVTVPIVPTVATPVLLLLHVPPLVELLNAVEAPTQIAVDDGVIPATVAITVTIFDAAQLPIE